MREPTKGMKRLLEADVSVSRTNSVKHVPLDMLEVITFSHDTR